MHPAGLVLVLATLGLAGCVGDSSPQDVMETSSTTSASSTSTNTTSDTTGPPGTNGTGTNQTTTRWVHDNRTGTVSGTDLVVTDPPSKQESLTVSKGTLMLLLNLTVEGDAMTMSVREPGCTSDDCAQEVQTQSGTATHAVQGPAEGTWTLLLIVPGPGPVSSDYTLEIAQQVPQP